MPSICPQCSQPCISPEQTFCSVPCLLKYNGKPRLSYPIGLYPRTHDRIKYILSGEKTLFLSKVHMPDDPNACWEWLASLNRTGYGQVRFRGAMRLAHRVAWILFVGEIPDGLDVLHDPVHCKSRACTNYKRHLRLGTDKDNWADQRISGTLIQGSRRWNAKLTEDMVQKMRYEYHVLGIPPRTLAKQFGVDNSTIVTICRSERWRHVPDLAGVQAARKASLLINRLPRGSQNPAAKLTEDQVREIRKLRAETGLSYKKISERFGVSEAVIRSICLRKTWKHVPAL